MIHLDTSALVDALTGPKRSARRLRELMAGPESLSVSSIVLFEWLRGPRLKEEIEVQEAFFPKVNAVAFGSVEAPNFTEKSNGRAAAKPIWLLPHAPSRMARISGF